MRKLRPIALIILAFTCGKTYAQFTQLWPAIFQHSNKPNFSNESRKVALDASGNSFVLADVTSDGVTPGITYHYVTLLKYSSAGALLAQKDISITNHVISGFDNFSAFGLEIDGSGNVYVGYALYNATYNFNVKISKYSNSLVRVWTNSFGGSGVETGVDMKLVSGSVYALIKSVSGGSTFYKLIKNINADGNATLLYIYGSSDVLKSITLDNNLNIYAAGYRTITGMKNLLLVSVTNAGTLRYTSIYNGGVSGDDYASMVTLGMDGNIYVAGTSVQGGGHGNDQVVLRYNSGATTGSYVWATFQSNSTSDDGVFIVPADAGSIYTGMVSNKKVIVHRLLTSNGHEVSSVNGITYTPLPSSSYNSITGVTLNDMKVSSNKNVYVTGSVVANNLSAQAFSSSYLMRFTLNPTTNELHIGFSNTVQGDFNFNYKGVSLALNNGQTSVMWLRDWWNTNATHASEQVQLLNMDVPSSLREGGLVDVSASAVENEVSFYPNPASGKIFFNSDETVIRIELVDLTGKTVTDIKPAENSIDISMVKPGIYFTRVTSLTGTQAKRVVIE